MRHDLRYRRKNREAARGVEDIARFDPLHPFQRGTSGDKTEIRSARLYTGNFVRGSFPDGKTEETCKWSREVRVE